MLAEVNTLGRVTVSGRGFNFALHHPVVEDTRMGDFAIHGQRRRRVGADRTWSSCWLPIAKVLEVGGGRLVLQDIFGSLLTLSAGRSGGYDDFEREVRP